MVVNEDTGEEAKCVICGSVEICEHCVACIDRTFLECEGGEMFDRHYEFSSAIEDAFKTALKSELEINWENGFLQELWNERREYNDPETEEIEIELDGHVFWRLVVELLEKAGAINPEGFVCHGGPGMTSSYSLLYAEKPGTIVDKALANLKTALGIKSI
tara:strand:+ start:1101 stop:1580 length:480 start_codon:yes stop_codon:yes gene_type:complete